MVPGGEGMVTSQSDTCIINTFKYLVDIHVSVARANLVSSSVMHQSILAVNIPPGRPLRIPHPFCLVPGFFPESFALEGGRA